MYNLHLVVYGGLGAIVIAFLVWVAVGVAAGYRAAKAEHKD